MVGRGAAGLGIVCIGLIQASSLQRGLHTAVGGEECDLLAFVLSQLLGDVLQDELLGSGQASLSGGVGSGNVDQLDAQSVSVLLHQLVTANDQLHSHVAGEGVVDQNIDAPVSTGLHDGVALSDFVSVHDDVSSSGDNSGVFLRSAGDQQDVVAAHLTDLVEASLCTGNSLAHNDSLDVGVRSEANQSRNGGFHFGHEVVGVSSGDDVVSAPSCDCLLSSTELFLTLGDGAGQNSDLPVVVGCGLCNSFGDSRDGSLGSSLSCSGSSGGLCATGGQGKNHDQSQQHSDSLFHCFTSYFRLLDVDLCLHPENLWTLYHEFFKNAK